MHRFLVIAAYFASHRKALPRDANHHWFDETLS